MIARRSRRTWITRVAWVFPSAVCEDSIFDWKFVGLAHNTLRGAAGGALESAEMLKALGYITKK